MCVSVFQNTLLQQADAHMKAVVYYTLNILYWSLLNNFIYKDTHKLGGQRVPISLMVICQYILCRVK